MHLILEKTKHFKTQDKGKGPDDKILDVSENEYIIFGKPYTHTQKRSLFFSGPPPHERESLTE